jgi:hypothetical protein
MKTVPITIDELARRSAARFLLDDCRSHPKYEALAAQARKNGLDIENFTGAPPVAAVSVINTIHGFDELHSLSEHIKQTLELENVKSVEAIRPANLTAVTARLTLVCDDHGIGGIGLTQKGVYDTIMAEREQLMRESKTHG